MGVEAGDFQGRRAPYAPISALEKFFERIRDRATPDRVDHKFLRKLNVAHNNEYSLLSALKFLGVLDDYGTPTMSYRQLQTTDQFKDTLWRLVQLAYKPVFEAGAEEWDLEELVNFFRVSSSPSQAKNAARFFRAVCAFSGHSPWQEENKASIRLVNAAPAGESREDRVLEPADGDEQGEGQIENEPSVPAARGGSRADLLSAKAALLAKLPPARPEWSAEQYAQICSSFVEMLRHLDASE
jgi:uncharacterized protein DUF5343